jgi:tetratricopeptide (TPR) repeat protein
MIVTFYSFKGGVGRSMAVANVADILARQGLRVLTIDFDLEAPGLEQYFQIDHRSARRGPGLLDLLLAYKRWMSVAAAPGEEAAFRRLDDFILPIFPKLPAGGRLDLLHAGRREPKEEMDRYASALRSFDWQDFYFNWDGELLFEFLRRELASPRYDLVIVDSRTGVTEMGGICTYQLADVIVLFTGANHQSRRGTLDVVRDFESLPVKVARRDRPLQMLVVPARVEQRDPALLAGFIEAFEEQFRDRLPARLVSAGLTFEDLLIPYEPAYAFEERVLSDPASAQERRTIAGAFERLAHAVRMLAATSADGAELPVAVAAAPTEYDAARRFASFDVFLSHAPADAALVAPLVSALRERRATVFVDQRDLVAAADWRARTEHALFHSRVGLVCFGPAGLGRRHLDELSAAAEGAAASHGLAVLPVLLPGADLDRTLASLPLAFARTVPLDLRDGLEAPATRRALDTLLALQASASAMRGQARAGAPETAPAAAAVAAGPPYPGARPFTEAEAGLLFGRTPDVDAVVDTLERAGSVIVVGPSACGKTSLLRAGVVPTLRQRAAARGEVVAVREVAGDGSPGDLDAAVEQLRALPGRGVCVVDQLERLLRHRPPQSVAEFLNRLHRLSEAGDIRLIMAMRDVRLREMRALARSALFDDSRLVRVRPLDDGALREIVERPAESAGLAFEPGLVERILADWGLDQRFLPFLQVVLHELWMRRREGFLTNRAYDEIDDPVEAVAERAFQTMGPELQRCAERVVPRLITLCGNLSPIGLSCRRGELRVSGISDAQLSRLIWHMADHSLFYGFADEADDSRIAPSFAAEQWPRVESWLARDSGFYTWLEDFNRRRVAYERSGGNAGLLLAGPLLDQAELQGIQRLTDAEIAFVNTSRGRATRVHRRRLINAAVLALAIGGGTYAACFGLRTRIENVSDAGVLVDLSRRLAESGQIIQANQGFDRALALYRTAGRENDVLIVRLERVMTEARSGSTTRAGLEYQAVLSEVALRPPAEQASAIRAKITEVAWFFYLKDDRRAAIEGFDFAWQLTGRRSIDPRDVTGHRYSLALARATNHAGARRVFREAIRPREGEERTPEGRRPPRALAPAIEFYERTLKDHPRTTQAYENLAWLLRYRGPPLDAILWIDAGIKMAEQFDPPIVRNLRESRRDLLKNLTVSHLAESDELSRYVCAHNFQVYVMSVPPQNVREALWEVHARLPLVEAAEPVGALVPLIGDFFLTCDEARAVVEKEKAGGRSPYVGDWYKGCGVCPGLPWRIGNDRPPQKR